MRLSEILRFETGYLLRQPATWLYLALLLAISLVLAAGANPLISTLNAPINIATWMLMIGLLGILVTAALFVEAGHREVRWRMDPLFYSSPLRKGDYLGGRFLGASLVNALLLVAVPVGLALSTLLPSVNADALGPFRMEAYLLPYLVLMLPNMLVNAAVLFGLTVMSRRSLPGYLGALVLIAAYLTTLNLSVGVDLDWMLALADPTGYLAMTGMTDGWTTVEQNTRLIRFDGILLWNRLLWLALAGCMLAFTYARFDLAHSRPGSARRSVRQQDLVAERVGGVTATEPTVLVPSADRSFGWRTRWRQTLASVRTASRRILMSREFLLIAAGMFVFAVLVAWDSTIDPMSGAARWPLTAGLSSLLAGRTLGILIALLTVFYAGETVWAERDANIQQLRDTRPVPDWVPFVGNFLALSAMVVALQTVLMGAGLVVQVLQGYDRLEPALYLQVLFGFRLVDYVLFAVLALLVHTLVNQKYLGHLVGMLLFIGIGRIHQYGVEHNLLIYGSDPGWVYSDISGFDPFVGPFLWFKLYWAAWALLLAVCALLFWVRGTEHGLRARVRLARQRLTPRTVAVVAATLVLVLTTGGFIFYNTNMLNEYRTAWEADAIEAEYERRYKRFEHIDQPWLIGTRLHVEIHPGQHALTVRGRYQLVNRTSAPIDSVHLSSFPYPELAVGGVEFDRPSEQVLEDVEHGYRIYALHRPLQPGDSLRMHFHVSLTRRGFQHREVGDITSAIRTSGTYLEMMRILPGIGYQRDLLELADAAARQEHGLPRRSRFRAIDDPVAVRIPRSSPRADWIDFEGTVGTASDQIAVLPGSLQRSWTEGDRSYFHYRSDAPIMNSIHLMSADYAVHQAMWKNVSIRVLHHPEHDFNVDAMAHNASSALDYYAEEFGPYPHRQFSLVEIPAGGNFGRAFPAGMMFTENNVVAVGKAEAGRDRTTNIAHPGFLVTAHETAHQWWGHLVIAADVAGSQVLSETLSQYSAAMAMEQNHGPAATRQFLRSMHASYLSGRGSHRTPEVPLMLTTDHDYIHYRKGPVVMYTLQDYLGEDRVNGALSRLVGRYALQGPPYPTTRDLYAELQAVSPDSLRYLLDDLLATITLWDLQTTGAWAEPTGTDEYRVTLSIDAAKLRSDSVGNHSEIPMDDPVEIGVFAGDGEPLYLRRHRIASGQQTITVTVSGVPARAGIDPYHKLITRHRDGLYETKITAVQLESGSARMRAPR